MTSAKLILRSLLYFKASHAALLAGMILVTAVLTGALILGDSVRDSLTDLAQRRRGEYDIIATAPGLFSQSLADFGPNAGICHEIKRRRKSEAV